MSIYRKPPSFISYLATQKLTEVNLYDYGVNFDFTEVKEIEGFCHDSRWGNGFLHGREVISTKKIKIYKVDGSSFAELIPKIPGLSFSDPDGKFISTVLLCRYEAYNQEGMCP